MTSLLTVTFTGTFTAPLQANFFPEIILDEEVEYSCALVDLIIKNSNDLDKLIKLDVIHIKCDIISGSYINSGRNQVIHQFATCTSHVKGKTFVESPKNLIYLPLKTKNLRSTQISILDHKGKPVNITSGEIICRINIKRENNVKTV